MAGTAISLKKLIQQRNMWEKNVPSHWKSI